MLGKNLVCVRVKPSSVDVWAWSDGSIDVNVCEVSKEDLANIAELTNKTVQINPDRVWRWVRFAKARDGSQVTFFAHEGV